MKARTQALAAGGILGSALIAFAFVAAPKSCQWGWAAYLWTGVAILVALFLVPFAFRVSPSVLVRLGAGVGFAIAGCAAWLAGLFAANFRIVCALI